VIGGEDDEEGEVSEPAELETGRVGEDEERGEWVAAEQEDGESQNTFNWIGWMTGRMDGWEKLHDHDVL